MRPCEAALTLALQAAVMAGVTDPFADPSMIGAVLTGTPFGYAVAARLAVTSAAVILLLFAGPRANGWALCALGAVAMMTLAWGGHGAADEGVAGWVHLLADLLHLLAAGLWIGALAGLAFEVAAARVQGDPGTVHRLYRVLDGFSGVGTLAVGLLILTGLVNSWFLVGPTHFGSLFTTTYGRLLVVKLAPFALMAGLAASNRWRLTPGLELARGAGVGLALAGLRRSIALETATGVAVLRWLPGSASWPLPRRIVAQRRPTRRRLERLSICATEKFDQLRNPFSLLVGIAAGDGRFHAGRHVIGEDRLLHSSQSRAGGAYLGDDVQAVSILLDHDG